MIAIGIASILMGGITPGNSFQAPGLATNPDEWQVFGETTAFGQQDIDGRKLEARKVQIKFPKSWLPSPADKPHIDWGNKKVEINEWGNIGRIFEGRGGWDEFATMYKDAEAKIAEGKSAVWKVKAVIFRKTDVLYRRKDGVLEPQRAYLNTPEVDFCLQTFARFEALAEAFTRGAIDIQITYSVEDDPIRAEYGGDDVWSFHPFDAGERYLSGRFNRGDFDSILYFYHAGTIHSYSFGGTIGRTNGATQSYVIYSNGREGDRRIGHTEAMLHEWFHQIEDTYSRWGYGGIEGANLPNLHAGEANGYITDQVGFSGWFSWMRDLMSYSVRPGMWAKLSNRTDPDFVSVFNQTKPFTGANFSWADVKDDPWAKLPYLTLGDIGKVLGIENIDMVSSPGQLMIVTDASAVRTPMLLKLNTEDASLNNELNFSREAVARIGYKDRDLLLIRFDAVDFVLGNLGVPVNVLGFLEKDGKFVVIADAKIGNDTTSEVNLLNLGSGDSRVGVVSAGDFLRNKKPNAKFSSSVADARFAVTDWEGNVVNQDANGDLDISTERLGATVLRATAILPSGERNERLFVVRQSDPVTATLNSVGTNRMSTQTQEVALTLQNGNAGSKVKVEASIPSGWKLTGIGGEVSLLPGEKKVLIGVLTAPDGAEDGPVAVAVDANVIGYDGPVATQRISIQRETQTVLILNSFEDGPETWESSREDGGNWTVSRYGVGVKGKCLEIHDSGGNRWGRVNAFGGYLKNGKRDPNFAGYDASVYRYLDFYLKTESQETLGFVVTLSTGKRYVVMLAGPKMEQWGESTELQRAKFIPNGNWQRVVYDLGSALDAAVGAGSKIVVDISLGDTRAFSSNQFQTNDGASYLVDEFSISRVGDLAENTSQADPDSEIAPGGDPASLNAMDRARYCAGIGANATKEQVAQVVKLLSDTSGIVRISAAEVFTRVKDPSIVFDLIKVAKNDPEQEAGVRAIRALAFQDTAEAWAAIEDQPRLNRYEEAPAVEACLILGNSQRIASRFNMLQMLTCKLWLSRAGAARGIGLMKDPIVQKDLMVYLLEIDPMVRIEVAKAADCNVDLTARRMEWGSVNDLSNVVRAYCYASLAKANDPATRGRGYAGLKEQDAEIRRIIAIELGNNPREEHVSILKDLFADVDPDVRSAAVLSLGKQPGTRNWTEFDMLKSENYEQVLLPMLELGKSGKINIPREVLDRLANHRNSDVRTKAKELIKG